MKSSRGRAKRIYLDYASATPVAPEALRALARAAKFFGNPGSIHREGAEAKSVLAEMREKIARELGVKARELVFVSGGTEANNLAILGFARRLTLGRSDLPDREGLIFPLANTHWITTMIEHPSILECFAEVERLGGNVTHLKPDKNGIIRVEELQRALRKETVFMSIAWANHEIGIVQPLTALSQALRAHEARENTRVLLHVDAGQAPLYRSPQLHALKADLVSLDSGKLYGPRGIGAVYVSKRAQLSPIVLGGGQERGLRAGTENIALIAGFAEALRCAAARRPVEIKRIQKLRDELMKGFLLSAPEAAINGDISRALPHILNISFPNINSEYLTLALDKAGIAVSTKSACREGEESVSRVVEALGGEKWQARNMIRFSLGCDTKPADIKTTILAVRSALLRKSS